MKYSRAENLINIIFLAALVIVPIGYILRHTNIPVEVGRSVIFIVAILSVFLLVDWYHAYITNTFKGIVEYLAIGILITILTLTLVKINNSGSIQEIAFFKDLSLWDNRRWLIKLYTLGMGLIFTAVYSIPRLILIKNYQK